MATRSFIAHKKGELYYDIYCHNDGYLDYNGYLLLKYYNTIDRLDALFRLGDISYLAARLNQDEEIPEGETELVTFSYWRDKGESMIDVQPRIHKDKKTLRLDDFGYLFEDGIWHYRSHSDQVWKVLTLEVTQI